MNPFLLHVTKKYNLSLSFGIKCLIQYNFFIELVLKITHLIFMGECKGRGEYITGEYIVYIHIHCTIFFMDVLFISNIISGE